MQVYSSVSFYSLSMVRLLPCFLSSPLCSCLCFVCPILAAFQGPEVALGYAEVSALLGLRRTDRVCVCPSLQFTNFTAN